MPSAPPVTVAVRVTGAPVFGFEEAVTSLVVVCRVPTTTTSSSDSDPATVSEPAYTARMVWLPVAVGVQSMLAFPSATCAGRDCSPWISKVIVWPSAIPAVWAVSVSLLPTELLVGPVSSIEEALSPTVTVVACGDCDCVVVLVPS